MAQSNPSPQSVIKDLKAKKFAPIYFLDGDEPFYIDQITEIIENTAIAEHERGFNQVVLYGKDSDMGTIINNARKFPMMADRQVVIVKEAQSLTDLGKEEAQKLLIGYAQNPLPSTILVLAHKYKKFDRRSALSKELQKNAIYVTSEKIKDYKLTEWVLQYFKDIGHDIEPRAAQFLAESIGNNLEVMTNEVGKMLINFKEPTKFTVKDISKFIGINKDYNNFELLKAIGMKDPIKSNKIVNYFIQNPKAHPVIPLFALMYNYFTKLAMIHEVGGGSDSQVASLIGVPPFVAKEYMQSARNYKLGKVIDVFEYLKEADLRYKGVDSGSMTDAEILRELIYKILH
ncbi:DNA polymerase III subunit delta [Algoriphagus machipongonensis]|uniref:DNA polymerase III subunit delta n=1 Tax=Algoriphagus machipongonensis TaxID=388413 RepID=A3HTF6_9BACT|nr:DNA polymerase III subunit delta [Algoriphagus machipongonensis]EAZ83124.1 DNA polymerase III, delta subunit [Algoriphagus machipongonensis]